MKLLVLSLIFLLSATTIAHADANATKAAGPQGSGGGKGVVCRDSHKNVKSVELLDLWEAKNLYGRMIKPSTAPLNDQVKKAFAGLKYATFMGGGQYMHEGHTMPAQEYFVAIMQDSANYFLTSNEVAHWLTNVTLEPTPDSFEQAVPDDCAIEQLVTYNDSVTDPNILINKDLWNRLDLTNRAALITHESLYAFLRETGEPDSVRTRRAVGYVFAGNIFQPLNTMTTPGAILCSGLGPKSLSEIVFYKDNQNKTAVVPLTLRSKFMLGFFAQPEDRRERFDLTSLVQSDPSCSPQYQQVPAPNGLFESIYPVGLASWSPIDSNLFDTMFIVCEDGKRVPYMAPPAWDGSLTDKPPVGSLKLSCYPLDELPAK